MTDQQILRIWADSPICHSFIVMTTIGGDRHASFHCSTIEEARKYVAETVEEREASIYQRPRRGRVWLARTST